MYLLLLEKFGVKQWVLGLLNLENKKSLQKEKKEIRIKSISKSVQSANQLQRRFLITGLLL